jgi:hypothetical protein
MSEHLKGLSNPKVKELVLSKLAERNYDFAGRGKKLLGAGATIADEALFGLPSKNSKIKGIIDEYEQENPNKHKVAKALGFVGSGVLPGMASVKVLSKVGKLGKLLKGGGLKQAVSTGAVYGGATSGAGSLAKGDDIDEVLAKTAGSAVAGGALGGLLGGTGRVLAAAAKKIKPISARQEARQKIDQVGKALFNKMSSEDIKQIENIIRNPVKSKYINFNTLLHRGTEKSKAVADALYQLSPKARKLVESRKEQLIKGQMPHIEETIIKTSGAGKRPNTEEFVKIMTKRHSDVAAPLYEKAYKDGVVNIPERLKGDKQFQEALNKALASINDVDKNKVGFEKHSVRVLDKTKRKLDDVVEKYKKLGERSDERDAEMARKALVGALETHSPTYAKAKGTAQKYLKIENAANEGKSFKKKTLEETENLLKNMTDHEKYAYKQGALEDLLNKIETRSKNVEFGQLGKDITNPQIKPLLNKILGDKKADQFINDINVNEKAVKNFKGFSDGSKTSHHESNKSLVLNAVGALRGKTRSIINLIDRVGAKFSGKNLEQDAKTQMKLLLDPKRLLKYKDKQVMMPSKGKPAAVGMYMRTTD